MNFAMFQKAISDLRSGNTGDISRKEYKALLIQKFAEHFCENSMNRIYEAMVELDYHKDGCGGQITIHFDEQRDSYNHRYLRFTFYGDHVSISGNEYCNLSVKMA